MQSCGGRLERAGSKVCASVVLLAWDEVDEMSEKKEDGAKALERVVLAP